MSTPWVKAGRRAIKFIHGRYLQHTCNSVNATLAAIQASCPDSAGANWKLSSPAFIRVGHTPTNRSSDQWRSDLLDAKLH